MLRGGLTWATDDRSLGNTFAQFDDIIELKIINDRETGRSRGFGFVTFKDEKSIRDVIEGMNDQDFDGRNITVNEAQSHGGGEGGGYNRSGGYGGGCDRGDGDGGDGGSCQLKPSPQHCLHNSLNPNPTAPAPGRSHRQVAVYAAQSPTAAPVLPLPRVAIQPLYNLALACAAQPSTTAPMQPHPCAAVQPLYSLTQPISALSRPHAVFDFLRLVLGVMLLADPLNEVAPAHMVPCPDPYSLFGPMATIAAGSPIALHSKSCLPIWILDYRANNHMTVELSTYTSPVSSVN
ncbi:cold, circadian rhythm, and rna binding 2 [Actinidia rufa]|uniref:Cold, circadian rhythm, and rna binding 2 n=1 Tax=Actinidia rufa TaxID=165716 RepID=A0A7J0EQV6_9ERIC|nr:cold, circadian rhythm, and rna binding 2 [Actinidia rufa]